MPRPRVLPFIILGVLNKNGMMSGKDMISEFNNEISEFWKVSHSQLYPELQRMCDEGQIRIVSDVAVQDRKVINYTIEPAGQASLANWISEPITAKNDELTSLKLYCIADQKSPFLERILRQALVLHEQKVKHLKERQNLLFDQSEKIQASYGHYLILTRAIEREENYLTWLKLNLAKIEK